jgi:ABC-type Mn2+/Zn2+ transport system ATPase subunit
MIRHLGSSLTDVTYVFDEPTIGMHPHDIERMNNLLLQLRDKGNTVLVVEHKPETITIADHVVDLGPAPARRAASVCFEGTVEGCARATPSRAAISTTGRQLKESACALVRRARGPGRVDDNLRDVDVDIPLGVLCVLTGVAGSGKSSLIGGSVAGRDGVVVIDQGAIRGSRRSNPATYTGLLEPIRKAFAKANGVKPALFSANSEGACPSCNGAGRHLHRPGRDGHRRIDVRGVRGQALPGPGARVHAGRQEHRRRAGDAGDGSGSLLRRRRCAHAGRPQDPRPARRRRAGLPLARAAADHPVGRRAPAAQAGHADGREGRVYVLDEPTTGLHLADVEQLLGLLDRLVDSGSRSSSSSTTRRSWRTPTGSSTSAPAPATTAAGSSSRARPPTSSPPAPPSPGEHLAAYVGSH